MRGWKRLFYYLLINVLVSACTMLVVLSVWQRFNPIEPMVAQIPFLSQSNPSSAFSMVDITETPADTDEPLDESELPSEEQPVPSQPPRTEEEEYRIQAGDTLGAIAVKYGVTVDEIMRANDLTDPDRLVVGVVLIIPVTVEEQPTRQAPVAEATPLLEATDTDTPPESPGETPSSASGPARVIIESVVGAGDLESERVLLKRSGPGELSLAGWQLAEKGGKSFIFPQLTLFEGGAVNVYTRAGQATVVALYWGLEEPVWESGEEVILLDNQGNEHASFTLP
jgi:LysM repeat protein